MTLHLELTPEQEARLNAAADQNGVAPGDVLKKLVDEHLPPVARSKDEAPGDPKDRVMALLAAWQAEDRTPLRPAPETRNGETPTQALFRTWEVEDAAMTEEEKEAEDRLWEDLERGLLENSRRLRLGRLIS